MPAEQAAKIKSLLVSLRGYGVTIPNVPDQLNARSVEAVRNYIDAVWPFVKGGHVKEAKQEAKKAIAQLNTNLIGSDDRKALDKERS